MAHIIFNKVIVFHLKSTCAHCLQEATVHLSQDV